MKNNKKIVECAREYIGTAFHHQGRVKGVGVDCAGLVVCSIKDSGILEKVPDLYNYARRPDGFLLQAILDNSCDKIDPSCIEVGDILLFRISGNNPQHLGLVSRADPFYMIHAYFPSRKVVEHRIDQTWWDKLVSPYRVRA